MKYFALLVTLGVLATSVVFAQEKKEDASDLKQQIQELKETIKDMKADGTAKKDEAKKPEAPRLTFEDRMYQAIYAMTEGHGIGLKIHGMFLDNDLRFVYISTAPYGLMSVARNGCIGEWQKPFQRLSQGKISWAPWGVRGKYDQLVKASPDENGGIVSSCMVGMGNKFARASGYAPSQIRYVFYAETSYYCALAEGPNSMNVCGREPIATGNSDQGGQTPAAPSDGVLAK